MEMLLTFFAVSTIISLDVFSNSTVRKTTGNIPSCLQLSTNITGFFGKEFLSFSQPLALNYARVSKSSPRFS